VLCLLPIPAEIAWLVRAANTAGAAESRKGQRKSDTQMDPIDDPDEKSRVRPSKLETLLNSSRFSVPIVVAASFIFVWFLGVLFGRGGQIYPIFNDIPENMSCPECRVFNDTSALITERQLRVYYQILSKFDLTRRTSFRLIRARIYGYFFTQELRSQDNCGVYAFGPNKTALHFNLQQENPATIELYCLDQSLLNLSGNIAHYQRDTKFSIVYKDVSFSNVCLTNKSLIFFATGWIISQTDKMPASVQIEYRTMENYSAEIPSREQGFMFDFSEEEILAMNSWELFHRVLIVAFSQSLLDQTVIFRQFTELPKILSVVKKATEEKFTSEQSVCFSKLVTRPDFDRVSKLSQVQLAAFRTRVTQKYENETDLVCVNQGPFSHDILKSVPGNLIELPVQDIKSHIKNISVAKALISIDDANLVINAFWLPVKSPLLLIVPPKRRVVSAAVQTLVQAGRKIVIIEGDVEGATSDHQEDLDMCLKGEKDANAKECEAAFEGVQYSLDFTKITKELAQANG
jgi:hypothetical protein